MHKKLSIDNKVNNKAQAGFLTSVSTAPTWNWTCHWSSEPSSRVLMCSARQLTVVFCSRLGGLNCSSSHQTLTQAIRFSSWDIICSAAGSRSLYSSDGTSRPSTRVTTVRSGRTVTDPCRAYARLYRVDQHQSIDEQHPVYKCSVNSSQQWQQGVWCAGQLVTTRCFSRRSTRHTILGCDELTVWRVDWHPWRYVNAHLYTATCLHRPTSCRAIPFLSVIICDCAMHPNTRITLVDGHCYKISKCIVIIAI